eukprot:s2262_g6.t1
MVYDTLNLLSISSVPLGPPHPARLSSSHQLAKRNEWSKFDTSDPSDEGLGIGNLKLENLRSSRCLIPREFTRITTTNPGWSFHLISIFALKELSQTLCSADVTVGNESLYPASFWPSWPQ